MKKFLLLIFFISIINHSFGQSCPSSSIVIAQETFSNTNNLTAQPGSSFFNDGSSDHFNVTDGSNISGTFSGLDGSFFAAEDVDDGGGTGTSPQVFSIDFDVSNFENLSFTGLFLQPETGFFDDTDDVTITASIDGSTPETLIDVDEVDDGDAFNQLAQINGTTLTSSAQEFSSSITGTGTTLTLTVTVDLNSGSETIAFDNFTICGVSITPITLSSFSAQIVENETLLQWKTLSELNNDFFEIKRSFDGLAWETIGSLPGNGSTDQPQYYEFKDKNLLSGTIYYQLKQTDFNGDYSFSEIVSVVADEIEELQIASATRQAIQLQSNLEGEAAYQIFNSMGKMVANGEFFAISGNQSIYYENADLAAGFYIIRVSVFDKTLIEKFIIQ